MKIFLDTCTLIWYISGDSKLSTKVKDMINDSDNEKFVSIATFWEMAIKISIGKLKLHTTFRNFINICFYNGFQLLPITLEHTLVVSQLELIHRDPFDRMLVAQTLASKMQIATDDKYINQYTVPLMW
ncbi:MAG: type II toxin-antitoxin system VapC family toxin [Ignavibacteria bacterium]|jgi:PIN domain nuclease of toxin-antitoxin system|nr:type II toxin-antitoxin system VapC family toxin [Ignavibacteria bacterium]